MTKVIKKISQKTYIDPKLNKQTRYFSKKEIVEWANKDQKEIFKKLFGSITYMGDVESPAVDPKVWKANN